MKQICLLTLINLLCLKLISTQPKCISCIQYRYREAQPQSAMQCPCVKPPGSNQCLSYDNRLQAVSLEEALHTFPDLSSSPEKARPLVSEEDGRMIATLTYHSTQKKIYKSAEGYSCDTDMCKACKLLVTNAFRKAYNRNSFMHDGMFDEMPNNVDESLCDKKNFAYRNKLNSEELESNSSTTQTLPTYLQEVISLLTPKIRKRSSDKDFKQKFKLLNKTITVLGVATTIGCNYKKGEEIAQGWTGLCSLCWQWRKLPPNYFPVLLNEVSCDCSDNACLSGFGNCRPVMRSINVVRNSGTKKSPRWVQESINTISACECQVEMGTPLHSLVLR
ncbi:unnamed protein product [Thelazia callipaeda]|uniref:Protein sleepless n=1 Tax=Thelazia callipaeda TaxID=103827 RepID=A0A158RC28_THECL|nr:unnamed protein product [Thelazia callipaeda]